MDILTSIGSVVGTFVGGPAVGIGLRMLQGVMDNKKEEKQADIREVSRQQEHRRELERQDFEIRNAKAIQEAATAEAEATARIDAGREMAAEDARTERETINYGNPSLWSKAALATTDWTGGFNRFLLAIVNFLGGLVRPVVTFVVVGGYFWMKWMLFQAAPVDTMTVAELSALFAIVWTAFDTQLIGTIVGFWFADRSLGKKNRGK